MTATENPADPYAPAVRHLSSIDADWFRLINLVGPCMHRSHPVREPYEALIRAVAYQQLHARAADAIIGRFLSLYPLGVSETSFPSPNDILKTKAEDLRSCGFSAKKIAAIQHIAEGTLNGLVPSRDTAWTMQDSELVARLVTLPGIGPWTVEMLLMHTLDRMDIMPLDDFGIREGYRFLKSMDALPNRKQMEEAALACSPYRTVASWYLWRVASLPDYGDMRKKKVTK